MINHENEFLPEINFIELSIESSIDETFEVIGDFPCPCCEYITILNNSSTIL